MIPTTLLTLIAANGACTGLLGTSPPRFYYRRAPQNVVRPYATWRVVSGVPENLLSETPPVDAARIQIDVWADSVGGATSADETATAIRNCLQASGTMLNYATDEDPETGNDRVTMDFQFWFNR